MIGANTADPIEGRVYGLMKSVYIITGGELFASEMMLQCWRNKPIAGSEGGFILALSGIVYLTSCNTFTHGYIPWLTPAYMMFVLLSVYRINHPRVSTEHIARLKSLGIEAGATRTWRFSFVRSLMLGMAMCAGATSSYLVYNYRNEINAWSAEVFRKLLQQSDQVGLNSTPQLGKTNGMIQSNARVLQIEALNGAPNVQHLRAWAYEFYEKGAWKPNPESRVMTPIPRAELEIPLGLQGSLNYKVKRLNPFVPNILVPLNSAGLSLETGRSLMRDKEHGNGLRIWANLGTLNYQYTTCPESFQGFLCTPPDSVYRQSCLGLPEKLNPAIRELADFIAGKNATPMEKIRALEQYFRTHHTYSLTTDPGPGDPVENFLIERKSAHCEYFASGGAVLLRCMGIPSRYVTGFYAFRTGGERTLLVRQRDAHAWCEAWIDGKGWVVVECTPPAGLPDATPDDLTYFERVRESLGDWFAAFNDWVSLLQWTDLVYGIGSVVVLWILLRALPHLRELFRHRKNTSFTYSEPERALAELASRFEKYLNARGAPCPPASSWREHLDHLERPNPEAGSSVSAIKLDVPAAREFAELYTRLRFGSRTPGELSKLAGVLTALEGRNG